MTPGRWEKIDALFAEAIRLPPEARECWLLDACAGDDGLRADVARLLDRDARAAREDFLRAPRTVLARVGETASWPPHVASTQGGTSFATARIRSVGGGSAEQQRLRDLTVIYLLIAVMMLLYKYFFMQDIEPTQAVPYAIVLAVLVALVARLSRPAPIEPGRLVALELGIIAMVATIFAFTQYQAMLYFIRRGDLVRAQFVVRNRVLITAVLILTQGIYAPGSWRHAARVVGPLAIMPFATILLLFLRHPEATYRLWLGTSPRGPTPLAPLGFDAMLLLILAAGSSFGARTISRLRKEVMEAQQLGQYHLTRRLGVGGMGEVYLAEHKLLKRPCAVKLIRPGVEGNPKVRARFEREVRLTAALSHPNTVEVYDYGKADDGTYYYVMEHLPGLNLAELVERHGPLPPCRVVYLLRQVCGALGEAHAAGLIHRDIKPSNIFAARRGGADDVAKLLDFGLVLPLARPDANDMSGEGQVIGTPLFMSPEQATGEGEIDGRSDIYSLGAVAYFLLTGRPPFDEDDGLRLLIAHARDPVVPPSSVRDGVPEDLDRVVLRCLAKRPDDRFRDAQALEQALAECACSGAWDRHRAARWWRDVDHASAPFAAISPPHLSSAARTAPG